MSNYVRTNCSVKKVSFTSGEVAELLGIDIEEVEGITGEFNDAIVDIIEMNESNSFVKDNFDELKSARDKLEHALKEKTAEHREFLNKYFLTANLSFFIGNGCSRYCGAELINKDTGAFNETLVNFDDFKISSATQERIVSLLGNRIEAILDKLVSLRNFMYSVEGNVNETKELDRKIEHVKSKFLEDCVLTIDYSKNQYHQSFLKKVVSRPSALPPVNLFTINYDLLLEKTAEQMEIIVNNGFTGFHNRVFLPSAFRLRIYLQELETARRYSSLVNIFKLHGSLSWQYSDLHPSNPYGLIEKQIVQNDEIPEADVKKCFIYPIQSKKRHSLDIPYSELFRQFVENLHKSNSVLIVIGYSFLDEHINDLILNALLKPDFNLVIFSFEKEADLSGDQKFLKNLINRSNDDPRISVFEGRFLGSFEYIAQYLMPYPEHRDFNDVIANTLKELKEASNGHRD